MAPLKLLNTIVLWLPEGFQDDIDLGAMMPRDASLSDSYTSDRDPGRFTPLRILFSPLRMIHLLDDSPLPRFHPRTFHPPDVSPPGRFAPRIVHPPEGSPPEMFTPLEYFLFLRRIKIMYKTNQISS